MLRLSSELEQTGLRLSGAVSRDPKAPWLNRCLDFILKMMETAKVLCWGSGLVRVQAGHKWQLLGGPWQVALFSLSQPCPALTVSCQNPPDGFF